MGIVVLWILFVALIIASGIYQTARKRNSGRRFRQQDDAIQNQILQQDMMMQNQFMEEQHHHMHHHHHDPYQNPGQDIVVDQSYHGIDHGTNDTFN